MKRFLIFILISLFTVLFATVCSKKVKIPGEGDIAPGFTLKNQVQMNVTLSNFRGKRNVILVFYPLDFTLT